ncbi:type VI secretion system-associated protein TagF [Methylocystis heyeri]|uniref:Type VI secretion system-associated protein TagF n=1 Tax=Methylocystis heyeri TaxID=391905 RepID=A0A6B8KM84_9HYPH|nr:type VI secretion system-associated protein TagF [Methylocystis heyeri]QGM48130.1 type VI secretion system-associated protein TagF [Methylocystis heyeri]
MANSCGLFGKLQAKRDFIAIKTPRRFLSVWEPWLQSSISASRLQLAADWRSAFLTAPIWRFWLGAGICGTETLGVTMPSMDQVGRYFPLTLITTGEEGTKIAPPEFDPQEAWFSAAEDFLLSTLEPDFRFEAAPLQLAALPAPSEPEIASEGSSLGPGFACVSPASTSFARTFERIRETGHALVYANVSYWWTIGGEDFERVAFMSQLMPDPHLYKGMLTGKFETQPRNES